MIISSQRRNDVRNWIKITLMFCIGYLSIFGMRATNTVYAKTAHTFMITPIMPSNQMKMVDNRFDLLLRPQEKEVIQVRITNLTSHNIDIHQTISNAKTAPNGGIVTDGQLAALTSDDSLQYPLTKNVALLDAKKLTIPAHKSIDVSAKILGTVDLRFAGLILGGWNFTLANNPQEIKSVPIGLHITKHVLGNLVLQTVNVHDTEKKFQLFAHWQNPEPAVLHTQMAMAIYDMKNQLISRVVYPNVGIAPNSSFKMQLLANEKALKAGRYRLEVNANSLKTNQKWHFIREINISDKHNQAVAKVAKPTPWIQYIFGGGIVGIMIGIFIWLRKKHMQSTK